MRFAFVIRLGNDTRPAEGLFEGWIEEVDSCTELRFHSTQELLNFLGQRFDLATAVTGNTSVANAQQPPIVKTKLRWERKSQ